MEYVSIALSAIEVCIYNAASLKAWTFPHFHGNHNISEGLKIEELASLHIRISSILQLQRKSEILCGNSPIEKLSVVSPSRPFTSSKQWSLYTTTLNTHWVRLGRVVMS